jgi:hypothetical protein
VDYLITISAPHRPGAAMTGTARLQLAQETYRRFHCFPASSVYRLRCPRQNPELQVDLGELCGLIYRSARGNCNQPQTFIHFLEIPARLTCDPSGRQLYIQGGNYRVTRRGIEG